MEDTQALARYIFTTGKQVRDRIFKAQATHLNLLGRQKACGELSMAQFNVVMTVRTLGPLSLNELSDCLMVSAPSTSAMVERLVEKGLLVRRHCETDRRRVEIQVSPEAEKDVKSCEAAILHSFVELVEQIGPETAATWREVLQKVVTVLDEQPVYRRPVRVASRSDVHSIADDGSAADNRVKG
jgi:DNA-binding MarR family transcriptional regulator